MGKMKELDSAIKNIREDLLAEFYFLNEEYSNYFKSFNDFLRILQEKCK